MVLKNIEYLLALHTINGLGPVRLKALIDYFEDPKLAWQAEIKELVKIGIPKDTVRALEEVRKNFNVDEYFATIQKNGISIITFYDDMYPALLKEIYDPPIILYMKGEFPKDLGRCIAVVGTRKVTGYGRLVTEKFCSYFVQNRIIIVSGLARGVDTVAHKAALKQKGQTIAVLGGGLFHLFPAENSSLAKEIVEEGLGCIVSEYPPNYLPLAGNFPSRNRIISGLSKAVLVTEAAEDSGSLITAKYALEQGREVFAIPGPITSELSKGPALLIKQGARMVTEPEEVLQELGLDRFKNKDLRFMNENIKLSKLSEIEKRILELLSNESKHIDQICRELSFSASQVSASLVKMEIQGLVKNLGAGNYIKNN